MMESGKSLYNNALEGHVNVEHISEESNSGYSGKEVCKPD